MNAMKTPADFKLYQLKAVLQRKGLSTVGNKSELIARLNEADPNSKWMYGHEADESNVESRELIVETGDVPSDSHATAARNRNDRANENLLREVEFMRRERQLMERELRVAEREIEILRNSP